MSDLLSVGSSADPWFDGDRAVHAASAASRPRHHPGRDGPRVSSAPGLPGGRALVLVAPDRGPGRRGVYHRVVASIGRRGRSCPAAIASCLASGPPHAASSGRRQPPQCRRRIWTPIARLRGLGLRAGVRAPAARGRLRRARRPCRHRARPARPGIAGASQNAARWWRSAAPLPVRPAPMTTRSNRSGRCGMGPPSGIEPRSSRPYAACADAGPLPMIDRLLGQAEVARSPPAHLDDHQRGRRPGIDRDEVQLVSPDMDVPTEDRPAGCLERCRDVGLSAASPARCASVRPCGRGGSDDIARSSGGALTRPVSVPAPGLTRRRTPACRGRPDRTSPRRP